MTELVREVAVTPPDALVNREWLVTNGLGGYASGTIGGKPTRRYHGVLIAALPNPAGRVMMLNFVGEQVKFASDGTRADLGWSEPSFAAERQLPLIAFRLELGLPVWTFGDARVTIERRLFLAARHNTVAVTYRLIAGDPVRLELRPGLHFRGHDDFVSAQLPAAYELRAYGSQIEIIAPAPYPPLRFRIEAPETSFVVEPQTTPVHPYAIEAERGYAAHGKLYSPGRFRTELGPLGVAFVASDEPWESLAATSAKDIFAAELVRREQLLSIAVPRARTGAAAELVLAADQFIFRPVGRQQEALDANAQGDEACSIIAGYHWFTDWGRDTMISLEGLTLATGRVSEAGSILRTFAHHVKDGLVPNMFPEGANEGLYHTADATLWFFHALDRYLRASNDETTLANLMPTLRTIIEKHLGGTRFGIGVDPADGLLREGAPGYQLTWMDALCDGWVVTPRRGKPVEINALWYNALCLMTEWLERTGDRAGAQRLAAQAEQTKISFGRRFWNPARGYLFDVVDGEHGDDPACRPNQLFALSLSHPVLDPSRWAAVLKVVEEQLVTPVGLRSLAPTEPEFKAKYDGDLRLRDAAYHQGTVWSWLIGAYVDARMRVHPDDVAGTRAHLDGLVAHLGEACIGSISEVFDAEPPFTPRGCIAQAWGVAELLRALLITSPR